MKKCTNKGQISLEYLMILGIALFLLIPIISLFYTSTVESNNLSQSNLMILSGRSLSTSAENVYYQGKGSKIKVQLNFPEMNNLSSLYNNSLSELVMSSEFDGLQTDFVFFVNTNLTFSDTFIDSCGHTSPFGASIMSSGPKTLFVESCGASVVIYEYNN